YRAAAPPEPQINAVNVRVSMQMNGKVSCPPSEPESPQSAVDWQVKPSGQMVFSSHASSQLWTLVKQTGLAVPVRGRGLRLSRDRRPERRGYPSDRLSSRELPERPCDVHELVEAPHLHDPPALEHDDLVGVADGAQTVRDDDARDAERFEALAHLRLR